MAAKGVSVPSEAGERMMRGVDILANAVKITLGPKGPTTYDNVRGSDNKSSQIEIANF